MVKPLFHPGDQVKFHEMTGVITDGPFNLGVVRLTDTPTHEYKSYSYVVQLDQAGRQPRLMSEASLAPMDAPTPVPAPTGRYKYRVGDKVTWKTMCHRPQATIVAGPFGPGVRSSSMADPFHCHSYIIETDTYGGTYLVREDVLEPAGKWVRFTGKYRHNPDGELELWQED